MSMLKKISLTFLLILLLLLGGVAGLVATQSGLHLLINSAARWVPGLDIAGVSGGWRNLQLSGVQYQMPGVRVSAGQLTLALDLGCLRHSRLCVNELGAQDVDVVVNTAELPPAEDPAASEPLTDLRTPYPIELRQLLLQNLKVTVDETAISLAEFRSGMQWRERALTVLPTRIDALLVALPKTRPAAARPEVPTAPEPLLGETLRALFAKPLLPELPDIRLPLDISVQEIRGQQLRLTGDTDAQIDSLLLQASTQDQHLQLDRVEIKSPQGTLSANGQATLNQSWPLALTLDATLNVEPLKGERIKLSVDGGLREQLKVGLNLSGPVRAQLELETALAEAGLPLALTLESKRLQWPLSGKADYQADELRLRFNGRATDYHLSLRSALSGTDLPPAQLTLDGKGSVEQFTLTRLRLAALQGHADLSGVVDWAKAISWNTLLTLEGINTEKQWPDWPARLAGKITTRGSIYGGSWQLQVPVLQLNGNVKQNRIVADGSLRGNAAGQWQIPGLDIRLGNNRLDVQGELGETWRLDANIEAPNLDGTLPGLGGRVNGTLQLRGRLNEPQLLMNLTATALRWQALKINRVLVNGNIRSGEQIQGELTARVEQLRQDALQVHLLTLDARGSERQHQLRLNIEGEPVSGQLALAGSFDRQQQRWQGDINNTRFDTPVGEWRLSRAIAIDYRNLTQTVSIGPHCWLNPNAELCVPQTIEAGRDGRASVVLNRFNLAMIKPFLGPDTELDGVFNGRAEVSWQAGAGMPQAKISLVGNGVKVQQMVQGNPLPIAFDTLTLNAALVKGRAQLDWLMAITDNGRFSGQVQVADPEGRRNLSGNIAIDAISLALINPILVQGEKAQGMMNANLRLGGNLQMPQIFGRLALNNVNVDGAWMPFKIVDGRLVLDFDGMTSTLEGLIRTSHGQMTLDGDADWRNVNAWRARIAAKGNKVRVTIPPMVRIDVSPDIVFEATPQLFSLNGSVDIPWARIRVQELPESAVGVSPDEVMLNDQLQPISPLSRSIPINSNLMIRIGNDVRLDAFGLKAQLRGDLRVMQDERGLGVNGQITIPSGRFHAYGQDLIVQSGQLLFSGPPERPLLNIKAIRNPDSTADGVTAGVIVSGFADAPRIEVFSDPATSQQEALSYLLRGQGLGSSGADGGMMTSMLIGMGVAQSGKLVGKIGEAFGVSNLALDTQGVGDNSQVVVSGYITPELQVKYGVGIFDSLATLTLRYRLMPRLYLEAVSGIDQALDVLYQFEF